MSVSRRNFMKLLGGVTATTLLPLERLPGMSSLWAAPPRRRHLINLVYAGGWDSTWMHAGFSERDLDGVAGSSVSASKTGFEYGAYESSTLRYTQKCSDGAERELAVHPDGRSRLGPMMGVVFENLQGEMQDLLIWKGLAAAGGHKLGNNLILQGNSSSYSVSYSGLIAEALAERDRRPLHYAMLTGSPDQLFTNASMSTGSRAPVCIPTRSQFEALTTVSGFDLQSAQGAALLQRTIARLATEGLQARLTRKAEQTVAGAFNASFDGASKLYGSQLLLDPEFKYLLKYYQLAIFRALGRAAGDANLSAQGELHLIGHESSYAKAFRRYRDIAAAMTPLPAFDQYMADPAAYAANVAQVNDVAFALKRIDYYEGQFDPIIQTQSFNYALAELLVRRNLSAVVDLPAYPGLVDVHSGYMSEVTSLLITLASFRAMIKSLKTVPGGDGGSLFGSTLIALHTEFDRNVWHNSREFTNVPKHAGTDHDGKSASLILAGYGVQRGKVIGDVNRGPRVHSAFGSNYMGPLPIDLRTGLVDPGGRTVSTLAILPTILAAFGVSVPLQQTTDWDAVAAVLDPSRA